MTKVLTFGTFDILHPGHERYLQQAKQFGDELIVVIARDETIKAVKGKLPRNTESKRKSLVSNLPFVTDAVLGNQGDKLDIVLELSPEIICLGYDQTFFTDKLQERLAERGLRPEIIRFKEGFHPEKYKSSLLAGFARNNRT